MLFCEGEPKPPLWFYALLALTMAAVWYSYGSLPAVVGWWVY